MNKYITLFILSTLLFSCSNETVSEDPQSTDSNPAAEGFDANNSDPKAIEIADAVMQNMGGRKAWDNTKIICWNFFDARKLFWNKHTGDVRIEFPESDSNVLITNIFTHQGKVKIDGEELTHPDSIQKYTEMAQSIWINDAYWLFMPFKLKDSQTTLKYMKIDTAQGGVHSHVLQLTFNEIGDTPENKYWVYVDTTTMLVNQWSYFGSYADSLPGFTTPWDDYKKYGEIMLSGGRGKGEISEIEVLDAVDENVFTEF